MSSDTSYLRRQGLAMATVALGGYLVGYAFEVGLTRFLGPEGFGDYKVAYSFAFILGSLVLLGGDRAAPMVLSRWIEQRDGRRVWGYLRYYLKNALGLAAVIAAVTWGLSWLHVGVYDPNDHHPLAWVVPAIPLNAAAAMISRTLQSARMPALAAVPWRVGLPLVQLVLFGLMIWHHDHLGVAEAILVSMAAIVMVGTFQALHVRHLGLIDIGPVPEAVPGRSWLSTSMPMMGAFLVAVALDQSDLYFLEALGDDAEVGHYAAAATAAHFLILIQTTMVSVIAPTVRPALDRGREDSRATFRRAQTLMLALLVPAALLLFLAAGPILILFGPTFTDARPALLFLTLGNFAWASAALAGLWLQYQGRGRAVLTVSIGALITDTVLNLALIPPYGMTGAAGGTAATFLLAATCLLWLLRRSPWKAPLA